MRFQALIQGKLQKAAMAMDKLDPNDEFPVLVSLMLARAGYRDIYITPDTRDGGVDIWAHDSAGIDTAFSLKRYAADRAVAADEMRQFIAVVEQLGVQGAFITTATFTSEAGELAQKHGVTLWDRQLLTDILGKERLGLTADYNIDTAFWHRLAEQKAYYCSTALKEQYKSKTAPAKTLPARAHVRDTAPLTLTPAAAQCPRQAAPACAGVADAR